VARALLVCPLTGAKRRRELTRGEAAAENSVS
jgi:hypothetical protein